MPGTDIGLKGCPSVGSLQLLRTGPAAVGARQQKSRHAWKRSLPLSERMESQQRALIQRGHMQLFLRGHSFPVTLTGNDASTQRNSSHLVEIHQ